MNKLLIDTSIIIPYLRAKENNLEKLRDNELKISVITHAEIQYGFERSVNNQKEITNYYYILELLNIQIININQRIAEIFSKLKFELEKKGEKIHDFDLFIAASALSENIPVVTYNIKHFQRIPNLILYQINNEKS